MCDARCAVVFDRFYQRCSNILSVQFPPAVMTGLRLLYTTCSTDLPVEALINGLAVCTGGALPPAPPTPVRPRPPPSSPSTAGTVVTLTLPDCVIPDDALHSDGVHVAISGPRSCSNGFGSIRNAIDQSAGSFNFAGVVELQNSDDVTAARLGRVT